MKYFNITYGFQDIDINYGVRFEDCSSNASGHCKSGYKKANGTHNGEWLTHPAFTFGNTELNGIWIGKFTMTGGNLSSSSPTNLTIKPNSTALQRMNIATQFSSLRTMDISYASNYGMTSSQVDIHMMKNMEWGAMVYLTNSKYGRYINATTCVAGGCEVWINPNTSYKTGCAGSSVSNGQTSSCNDWTTTNGKHASTTDNQYGIYDVSGGTLDYYMGNVSSSTSSYVFYNRYAGFSSEPLDKYLDKYVSSTGSNADHATGKLGDATKEFLKNFGNLAGGWYSDYAGFPDNSQYPWIGRGLHISNGAQAGIYSFCNFAGESTEGRSYRAAITEQDGSYNGNGLS